MGWQPDKPEQSALDRPASDGTEPPARAATARDSTPAVTDEPEAYELIVGTFAKFSAVNAFLNALRTLPGVRDVRSRRFQRGTLHVRVEYDNPVPLAHRLKEVDTIPIAVRSASGNEIEVTVLT